MDPISASALVVLLNKLFDGAIEEVAGEGVRGFTEIIRRALRRPEIEPAPEEVRAWLSSPSDNHVEEVAAYVAALAAEDPVVAAELQHWQRATSISIGSVTNNATGTFHGQVIQAGVVRITRDR